MFVMGTISELEFLSPNCPITLILLKEKEMILFQNNISNPPQHIQRRNFPHWMRCPSEQDSIIPLVNRRITSVPTSTQWD
ncbi:hypothetical protein TNCV_1528991 [Trichonephila clavipes]|uniref:Uncharacterized protein n=1 Tax=Trichonephila clavipes TaxID=2585209 RepID=A0A8X6SNR2_TRICX|nr:hypothetical protein TNCV_1528991 [Trichonephila clavipes]